MAGIQSVSGKERKALIAELSASIPDVEAYLPKKGKLTKFTNDKSVTGFIVDKQILVITNPNHTYPSLRLIRMTVNNFPNIVVDTGAIRFVTNGADIMRPGIVSIDEQVIEGGLVVVREEKNNAPLAIGISMYDHVDMRAMASGKCIKTLHYLSDEWWDFSTA